MRARHRCVLFQRSMIFSPLFQVLCLAVFAAYAAEAFVPTVHAPFPLSSLVGPSSTSIRTTGRSMVPAGCFGTRAALTPAPRMAAYEDGASAGSGEIEMEMQELIVDFTDDGRILLEVKGVKGQECRQITEELIKALGDVITTENTAEYFEEKVVSVQKDALKVGWTYDANKPEW